jgi:hypothetical protein
MRFDGAQSLCGVPQGASLCMGLFKIFSSFLLAIYFDLISSCVGQCSACYLHTLGGSFAMRVVYIKQCETKPVKLDGPELPLE